MTVAVPLTKKFGLGSVLGYLIAGLALAPVFRVLNVDIITLQHAAEFGVVVMLFLVGLELEPRTLWRMRQDILGVGGIQVGLTAALIYFLMQWLGPWAWQTNLAIALALALSSTAIALQTFAERGEMAAPSGRNGFAVLLFQDIAVIPILALVPLLAMAGTRTDGQAHSGALTLVILTQAMLMLGTPMAAIVSQQSWGRETVLDLTIWMQWVPNWAEPLVIIAAILGLLVAARYAMRPVLRYVAGSQVREIIVGFSIFLVIGSALLMNALGLSAALGAFLAGVMLADSEYRHEIEADLEPLKGLLLGVFFMTTGAALDTTYVINNLALVLGLVAGLVILKTGILWILASVRKLPMGDRLTFSVLLSQGGEFAFVLLLTYGSLGLVSQTQSTLVTAVVSLSMLSTPLLLVLVDRLIRPRLAVAGEERDPDVEDEGAPVIIAGFGRFGQVTGRVLATQKISATILDHDAQHIDFIKRFGGKVYYGDATRLDLLAAAGAKTAKVLVIAIDDVPKSLLLATEARRHFPHLKILARARNRRHAYDLIAAGVDDFYRETFYSAAELAGATLGALGIGQRKVSSIMKTFVDFDRSALAEQAVHRDDFDVLQALAQRNREELEAIFERDQAQAEEDA